MSSRATFLVDHRRYESSSGAVGLDLDLLAGPRAFVPFAEAHAEAAGPWYDDEACETGALVDTRAKVLLVFAWEGVFASTRTRAAAFELLRRAWPGWRVRWLYDGQRGLRAYAGAHDPPARAGGSGRALAGVDRGVLGGPLGGARTAGSGAGGAGGGLGGGPGGGARRGAGPVGRSPAGRPRSRSRGPDRPGSVPAGPR
ncbi:hypothetical protein [Streptomyces sp. NPDC003952]